jgi:hypothetical protein
MSRLLGGFKHRYPQSFLDKLAKAWGFKWTKVEFKQVDAKDVEVSPMPPPSGQLYYIEMKYDNKDNEQPR